MRFPDGSAELVYAPGEPGRGYWAGVLDWSVWTFLY